jgi:hypothetical protein
VEPIRGRTNHEAKISERYRFRVGKIFLPTQSSYPSSGDALSGTPSVGLPTGLNLLIPVRFRAEIHAIWRSLLAGDILLAGDGYERNRLQAGSYLPAD